MNDTISSRIRRIITGTANSIVAKIEGLTPEAILEAAISEVDSAITEVKVELGRITAQKHHVTKAMSKLNDEHSRIDEQMEVAQAQSKRDLLEAGISRQLDIEDQLPALETQLGELAQVENDLNKAISGLVAKRNEMEDELFDFKRSQQVSASGADTSATGAGRGNALDKAERADKAFGRVLQNATGIRRSSLKASSAETEKLVELARLSKQARIEARLKALESE